MPAGRPRGRPPGVAIDADALRRARLEAGLTLAEVAAGDLTRQAVQRIEAGRARPSMKTLEIIADRLGRPASAFMVKPDVGTAQTAELREAMELGLELLREPTAGRARAGDHAYVGQLLVRLNRPDEALPHLRLARSLFEAADNPWLAVDTMDWEAGALYLKEDPRALALATEAVRRYGRLAHKLPGTEARLLQHLGAVYIKNGSYQRALACYGDAMRVAGTIRDPARSGRLYHGLSSCHRHFREYAHAVELARRAIALYELEQDQSLMARGENVLGLAWMRQGHLDRAEESIRKAVTRLETAGLERGRSQYLIGLGELRLVQDRVAEALAVATQALTLAERFGETLAISSAHQQLGEIHARELADDAFRQALAALPSGLPERGAEILAARARAAELRR